jgi:hypothetical protein
VSAPRVERIAAAQPRKKARFWEHPFPTLPGALQSDAVPTTARPRRRVPRVLAPYRLSTRDGIPSAQHAGQFSHGTSIRKRHAQLANKQPSAGRETKHLECWLESRRRRPEHPQTLRHTPRSPGLTRTQTPRDLLRQQADPQMSAVCLAHGKQERMKSNVPAGLRPPLGGVHLGGAHHGDTPAIHGDLDQLLLPRHPCTRCDRGENSCQPAQKGGAKNATGLDRLGKAHANRPQPLEQLL